MKPNILFIVIDSFRADTCYENNRITKTPNIDRLIKKGVFFNQCISSVDATAPSMGCVFSSKYPFQTGITIYKNYSKATAYLDLLKDFGYKMYATVHDDSFFKTITCNFETCDYYSIQNLLNEGTGQKIINRLDSSMKNPWFYYIHILDLHPIDREFVIPKEFDSEKFGKTKYERAISATDVWIGKILEKINLENTLVILTSDHGEYVPVTGNDIASMPTIHKVFKKTKQIVPFLDPIGWRLFLVLKSLVISLRRRKLKKHLTDIELRTLYQRGSWYLYDDIIRVPLIFVGNRIPSNMVIEQQVRLIDIFPTITELIESPKNENVAGTSLVPLLKGKRVEEKPVYIESSNVYPNSQGKVIGIRTSKFKYFRARKNRSKNIYLYDLEQDPLEKNNLDVINSKMVDKMENILNNIRKSFEIEKERDTSNGIEEEKIKEELRKLGYL